MLDDAATLWYEETVIHKDILMVSNLWPSSFVGTGTGETWLHVRTILCVEKTDDVMSADCPACNIVVLVRLKISCRGRWFRFLGSRGKPPVKVRLGVWAATAVVG